MILRTSGIGVSIAFLREAQWGSRGREFDSRHSDQEVQRFRNRSRWTFSFLCLRQTAFLRATGGTTAEIKHKKFVGYVEYRA